MKRTAIFFVLFIYSFAVNAQVSPAQRTNMTRHVADSLHEKHIRDSTIRELKKERRALKDSIRVLELLLKKNKQERIKSAKVLHTLTREVNKTEMNLSADQMIVPVYLPRKQQVKH